MLFRTTTIKIIKLLNKLINFVLYIFKKSLTIEAIFKIFLVNRFLRLKVVMFNHFLKKYYNFESILHKKTNFFRCLRKLFQFEIKWKLSLKKRRNFLLTK